MRNRWSFFHFYNMRVFIVIKLCLLGKDAEAFKPADQQCRAAVCSSGLCIARVNSTCFDTSCIVSLKDCKPEERYIHTTHLTKDVKDPTSWDQYITFSTTHITKVIDLRFQLQLGAVCLSATKLTSKFEKVSVLKHTKILCHTTHKVFSQSLTYRLQYWLMQIFFCLKNY